MDNQAIISELEDRFKNQPFGGIVTRREMPALIGIAPVCGDPVKLGPFTVTRHKVDQLDQFTVLKERKPAPRCPDCGGRLDEDGSCWWCENPE
jgi:hypothetical protein